MNLELLNKSNLSTPKFTLNGNIYIAKCVKCYDADTIHIVIYLYNKLQRFVCRLLNIDTAEIRSKNINEKNIALNGKKYLQELILDKLIIVKCYDFDKYGRLLVYIYLKNNKIQNLKYNYDNSINKLLVDKKFGYEYYGGNKITFEEWFINT